VVLALGRTGTPRKLGVKDEELPKVMYRLIEADHYINKQILVVGGGDTAVEAAMGLAYQVGNKVTLSYRQGAFGRIRTECSTHRRFHPQRESERIVQLKPGGIQREFCRVGCERFTTGDSE